MDLSQFKTYKVEFSKNLLIIKGSKGFLACAYMNVETANKLGEACVLVTGVSEFEDMFNKYPIAISEKAKEMGVTEQMTGEEVLELFK